jgi:hypothetical protein
LGRNRRRKIVGLGWEKRGRGKESIELKRRIEQKKSLEYNINTSSKHLTSNTNNPTARNRTGYSPKHQNSHQIIKT